MPTITFRVSNEELEWIRSLAKIDNRTVSSWIRMRILGKPSAKKPCIYCGEPVELGYRCICEVISGGK